MQTSGNWVWYIRVAFQYFLLIITYCCSGDQLQAGLSACRHAYKTCNFGSGVPGNFVRGGGGFNKFSWGQRERGSGGGRPL